MKESSANLWDSEADAVCITTNGFVKKNGEAAMGRGCAEEAAAYMSGLPSVLGQLIKAHGNFVFLFGEMWYTDGEDYVDNLVTLPVKHNWWELADRDLIIFSLGQLIEMTNFHEWKTVSLPRPGCGNGGLYWDGDEYDIKRVCEKFLDDRFIVHHKVTGGEKYE